MFNSPEPNPTKAPLLLFQALFLQTLWFLIMQIVCEAQPCLEPKLIPSNYRIKEFDAIRERFFTHRVASAWTRVQSERSRTTAISFLLCDAIECEVLQSRNHLGSGGFQILARVTMQF